MPRREQSVFENIEELKSLAEKYSSAEDGNDPRQALSDLLEHTSLFANVDSMDEGLGADGTSEVPRSEAAGAITLSHSSPSEGFGVRYRVHCGRQ